MGNPKDIFKNHSPLTEQEMKDYLSGNLSESRRKKIEQKLAQDQFNMDALEGIEKHPSSLDAFQKTKDQVFSNIDKKSGGWQFHHTILVSVALMAITMTMGPILFPEHGKTPTTTIPAEVNEQATPNKDDISEDHYEDIIELSDDEIEAAVMLDELEIVQPKNVISSSPVVIDSAVTSDPVKEELAIKESIEIKKVAAQPAPEEIITPTKDDIVYSNVPLTYLRNFLLVNYSEIYTETPKISQTVMTGTSAALENKEDQLNEGQIDDIKIVEISYLDFIGEAQEMFEKHQFKSALKKYKVILKQYPEDLNAHFYSGLCYYNLGKNDLAMKHFQVAFHHPYNTFKIDAQWYKAKTYIQSGNTEKAKYILNKIIEDGDYYKTQAETLLKKL